MIFDKKLFGNHALLIHRQNLKNQLKLNKGTLLWQNHST